MKFPIKTIKRNNQIVALPKNTSEVSKLVKFSKKIKYHILPIGGETNRVDGTKPQFEKTILIDFKKMNRIEEVDTNNFIITAQGGTLLKTIQKSANSKKLLFPVNIAPNDKCTIGGNISTNVGGLQTLRYGNIEDHVNGLEVVLSDGTILNFLNKLKKDNYEKDTNELLEELNLNNNYFSIRGELIYVNSQKKEVVIRICSSPTSKRLKNPTFKITIEGEISLQFLNNFVSLDVIRDGNILRMVKFEIIEKIKSEKS